MAAPMSLHPQCLVFNVSKPLTYAFLAAVTTNKWSTFMAANRIGLPDHQTLNLTYNLPGSASLIMLTQWKGGWGWGIIRWKIQPFKSRVLGAVVTINAVLIQWFSVKGSSLRWTPWGLILRVAIFSGTNLSYMIRIEALALTFKVENCFLSACSKCWTGIERLLPSASGVDLSGTICNIFYPLYLLSGWNEGNTHRSVFLWV